MQALRRFTVRARSARAADAARRARDEPALVVAPGDPRPVRVARPGAVADAATATRSQVLGEVSRPSGWPRWPRTASSCAGCRTSSTTCSDYLTQPRWYQSAGRRGAGRVDRLLLAGVRHHRGAAAVLRRPRHPGRRPPQGAPATSACRSSASGCSTAPATSASRCRADGWQLEHYPSLDPHGLPIEAAARAPTAAPRVIAVAAARGPHAARARLAARRSAGCRCCCSTPTSRRTTPPSAPGHRPALRRRRGPPARAGDAARHRRRAGAPRLLRGSPARPQPEVFHTNEGHAGFLGVERIRELVEAARARASTRRCRRCAPARCSPRTPRCRPASTASRATWSQRYLAGLPGVPLEQRPRARRRGRPDDVQHGAHGPAARPARQRRRASCTAQVSREMFADLWPGFDADEVPIGSITNGVHAPTWMAREIVEIGRARGQARPGRRSTAAAATASTRIADRELWSVRGTLRARLVDEVRRRIRESGARSAGTTEAELGWTDDRLRPRRPHHRLRPAGAVLQAADPDAARPGAAARRCCSTPSGRCRSSSPARATRPTTAASSSSQQMVRSPTTRRSGTASRSCPTTTSAWPATSTGACDVWLNNPLRPLEACGTSGMKAALNGGAQPVHPRRLVGRVVRRRRTAGRSRPPTASPTPTAATSSRRARSTT